MECKTPTPPTYHTQATPCCYPNMSHRTPPPYHPQHGTQNGAAVEMVVVVDSGMVVAGMAVMVRHSYYPRLYIFYLCNKLILFFVFCETKVVNSNNNK